MRVAVYGEPEELAWLWHKVLMVCGTGRVTSPADIVLFDRECDFVTSVAATDFDVILAAKNGASGLESLKRVRLFNRESPVIWLTDCENYIEMAGLLDVAAFVTKPIEDEKLKNAIEMCKEWKSAREYYDLYYEKV